MTGYLMIQVIFLVFVVFAGSRAVLRLKEGSLTFGSFLFWFALWTLAVISIIEPEFTTYFAKIVGIGRGTDAVIYLSIVLLFYLLFRTNVMIENLKHEITKLTGQLAIKRAVKKNKR